MSARSLSNVSRLPPKRRQNDWKTIAISLYQPLPPSTVAFAQPRLQFCHLWEQSVRKWQFCEEGKWKRTFASSVTRVNRQNIFRSITTHTRKSNQPIRSWSNDTQPALNAGIREGLRSSGFNKDNTKVIVLLIKSDDRVPFFGVFL